MLLSSVILGLCFSGLALSRPQVAAPDPAPRYGAGHSPHGHVVGLVSHHFRLQPPAGQQPRDPGAQKSQGWPKSFKLAKYCGCKSLLTTWSWPDVWAEPVTSTPPGLALRGPAGQAVHAGKWCDGPARGRQDGMDEGLRREWRDERPGCPVLLPGRERCRGQRVRDKLRLLSGWFQFWKRTEEGKTNVAN